ncbi:ArsR/SmtB family transcription factor [Frondihabitans australicus]|uniref:DNA-binding transcriptional ArsR family regulator n=1 Tax=Frondihabitans australicus TaxID=386892 RepID=A0A495IAM0_9MICO|nr:helix-turn-helix domain-containing protein [Frondihabitans australicus]RKR73049.1 DNA-binding transcriptional ArsR family regulator [Frondihabitans australicus]
MADIYAVIADPTRRDLLRLLLDRRGEGAGASPSAAAPATQSSPSAPSPSSGDISVGDIVTALGFSQPTVSKHLRVLREAGLVHVREVGQHRYYSVDEAPLTEVLAWLEPFFPDPSPAVAPGAGAARTSPVPVPAPLRRAAGNLPDPSDVGASLGRTVAGARSRILDPVKKRLGHREQG